MKINEYYLDGDSPFDFHKWTEIFETDDAFKGIEKEVPHILTDVDDSLIMVYKFKGKIINIEYCPDFTYCIIRTLLDLETILGRKLDKHIVEIEDSIRNINYWNGKK